MPKIKISKSSPSLDMTPMVDLGFLLVTFFMLTSTSFRQAEPVIVDTPASYSSDIKLPENTLLITIDTAGRAYFNINGADIRTKTLERMMNHYSKAGNQIDDKMKVKFARMGSFGVPFEDLPEYLNAKEEKRKLLDKESKGIPFDTTHEDSNELRLWINFARVEEKTFRDAHAEDKAIPQQDLVFAIKADGLTAYKKVKDIINVFKDQGIYTFHLITTLKKGEGMPGANSGL